jgi:hypothetical protein
MHDIRCTGRKTTIDLLEVLNVPRPGLALRLSWKTASLATTCLLQVAVAFAAMHDTPARMVAKGVLRGVVPWTRARPFFVWRLRRR